MLLTASAVLTVIFPFYAFYKPPSFIIRYLQSRWSDQVLFHLPTKEKVVALTIDDAPSRYTEDIVKTLREHGAQATFFVIGGQVYGDYERNLLAGMVRDGMELGNHAMHDELSRARPNDQLEQQIRDTAAMIDTAYATASSDAETTRQAPKFFRPGGGLFSKRMLALADKLGYRIILGNIYPHDAQVTSWRINAAHILSMLQPGGIIICHDRRDRILPLLRRIIPEIISRGYRITTVSGLLQHQQAVQLRDAASQRQ